MKQSYKFIFLRNYGKMQTKQRKDDNMLNLIKKNKETILYLIFGICTTIINIFVYGFSANILLLNTVTSTIIAWIISVIFAYITNRKFVFNSNTKNIMSILKEFISFMICRITTGLLDVGIMYLFVDKLNYNGIIIKIASNVLVIIINYIVSKLVIFKHSPT